MLMRLAAGVILLLSACAPASDLTEATFARWKAYLQPSEAEQRWQQIPWRSAFLEGVAEARRRDRPLLVWAMNGHPLACT